MARIQELAPELLYNFDQPWKPCALRLPPGRGVKLRRDMEELVRELRTALAGAFESDEYRNRRQVIEHEFKETQERSLNELPKRAQERGLALLRTPVGLIFAPVLNNEVIAPDEYQNLPEETRQKLEADVEALQEELQQVLAEVPKRERQARERLAELNRDFTNLAIGSLFDETRAKYQDLPDVVNYINAVQHDVIETAQSFVSPQEAPPGGQPAEGEGEKVQLRPQRECRPCNAVTSSTCWSITRATPPRPSLMGQPYLNHGPFRVLLKGGTT